MFRQLPIFSALQHHKLSHKFAFSNPVYNSWLGIFANLPIGVHMIDMLLGGRIFRVGQLTELVGPSSSSKTEGRGVDMRLLIIDSISLLIMPVLGSTSSQGRALMVSAGYLLKNLADQHNLAVLVTNHTVGGEGGTLKPAPGEIGKAFHIHGFSCLAIAQAVSATLPF
ncbi:DNA repair protein [Corchorus capsularis]|uniref:DNA repair protein n=1 Tax=Corchorus capsularis TaxID=210143 RepID=A0A1R3GT45_COCAP|nr:DNA repair protein [Corchorus capsularis]